jgi:hypothetical protein
MLANEACIIMNLTGHDNKAAAAAASSALERQHGQQIGCKPQHKQNLLAVLPLHSAQVQGFVVDPVVVHKASLLPMKHGSCWQNCRL